MTVKIHPTNVETALKFISITGSSQPELEPVLGTDPAASFWYAAHILKSRFPAGEDAIARDPYLSLQYAVAVINQRFFKGEPAIAKSIYASPYYLRFKDQFVMNTFIDLEQESAKDWKGVLQYARLIKGRFPQGELTLHNYVKEHPGALKILIKYYEATKYRHNGFERLIAASPSHSYEYAIHLRDRFFMGEPEIAKCKQYALLYAKDVIKGPFVQAESLLAKDANTAYHYAQMLGKRFHIGEAAISRCSNWAYFYALNVIKGRWHEGEKAIAKDATLAFIYAENVCHGPFREGERTILRSQQYTNQYRKLCARTNPIRQAALCPMCYKVNIVSVGKKTCNCFNCEAFFRLDDKLAQTRRVKIKPEQINERTNSSNHLQVT